ncbi:PilZ domain-containing protein [Erythrobacter fulvus]|uniref:PilZ domain-containing protein n=1 Tax=Erythrobacter fulvus TaxID=2987523 RepID=UPI0035ABEA4D
MFTIPKRQPKRLRIFLQGSLAARSGLQEVRVRDISKVGALIEALSPPGVREKVSLMWPGHLMEGVVVWQKDSRCGIRFESPLCSAVLDDFSGQRLRVGASRNYRRDHIADDDIQVEVTPRTIRLRVRGRTN